MSILDSGSALNTAAAATILNKSNVDPSLRVGAIAIAATTRGVLGLALPLILARNAQSAAAAGGSAAAGGEASGAAAGSGPAPAPAPALTEVPNLAKANKELKPLEAASAILELNGLVAVPTLTYSDSGKDLIVGQDPHHGHFVAPGSGVRVYVSAGIAPVEVVADDDGDEDDVLASKIDAAKKEIEDNFKMQLDANTDRMTTALNSINETLKKIQNQSKAA